MLNTITIQQMLSGLYVVRANGKECWIGEYSEVAPKAVALALDLDWVCRLVPASKVVADIVWKD